jgi:hypothetical protein
MGSQVSVVRQMVRTVNIAAVVLAGENLALNILAGCVVYYSPGWIFPHFVFMLHRVAQTTLAATATSLTFLLWSHASVFSVEGQWRCVHGRDVVVTLSSKGSSYISTTLIGVV